MIYWGCVQVSELTGSRQQVIAPVAVRDSSPTLYTLRQTDRQTEITLTVKVEGLTLMMTLKENDVDDNDICIKKLICK